MTGPRIGKTQKVGRFELVEMINGPGLLELHAPMVGSHRALTHFVVFPGRTLQVPRPPLGGFWLMKRMHTGRISVSPERPIGSADDFYYASQAAWLMQIRHCEVPERLLWVLRMLADKTEDGVVHATAQDLASICGCSREMIGRACPKFESIGEFFRTGKRYLKRKEAL